QLRSPWSSREPREGVHVHAGPPWPVPGEHHVDCTTVANGEVNDGVLLASTHWDGVDYNSSETVRDRPSLRVQFVPPPSPLVLAYDMETLTPDGRMQDRSGSGNHGIINGTLDVAGKVGRAREFDGIHDYIEVPDSPRLYTEGGITIAAWVYMQADD